MQAGSAEPKLTWTPGASCTMTNRSIGSLSAASWPPRCFCCSQIYTAGHAVWFVVGPWGFREGPGSPHNPDGWPWGVSWGPPEPPGPGPKYRKTHNLCRAPKRPRSVAVKSTLLALLAMMARAVPTRAWMHVHGLQISPACQCGQPDTIL